MRERKTFTKPPDLNTRLKCFIDDFWSIAEEKLREYYDAIDREAKLSC